MCEPMFPVVPVNSTTMSSRYQLFSLQTSFGRLEEYKSIMERIASTGSSSTKEADGSTSEAMAEARPRSVGCSKTKFCETAYTAFWTVGSFEIRSELTMRLRRKVALKLENRGQSRAKTQGPWTGRRLTHLSKP